MRLLLDEMLTPRIAEQLRLRGHDVEAVAARPELRKLKDIDVFTRAQMEDRAIVTENIADFRRIAAGWIQGGEFHRGLILSEPSRYPRKRSGTVGRLVVGLDALLSSNLDLTNIEYWLP